MGDEVSRRRSLRRLATTVTVAAAAAVSVAGCGSSSPNPPKPHGLPQTSLGLHPVSAWQNVDGQDYIVRRSCASGTGDLLYLSEEYDGGGMALVPGGCAHGDPGSARTPAGLSRVTEWKSIDGDSYIVSSFCDRSNGNLLYVYEAYDGGGIAVDPNGCAVGAPRPRSVVQTSDWYSYDSSGGYDVASFCDPGNGTELYVSEADKGGSIFAVPGGCTVGQTAAKPKMKLVSLNSDWQNLQGWGYYIGKWCDLKNGALLYLTEGGDAGTIAVDPHGCDAVVNKQAVVSRTQRPAMVEPVSPLANFDGQDYQVDAVCDPDNGDRIIFSYNYSGSGAGVEPGACRNLVDLGGLQ